MLDPAQVLDWTRGVFSCFDLSNALHPWQLIPHQNDRNNLPTAALGPTWSLLLHALSCYSEMEASRKIITGERQPVSAPCTTCAQEVSAEIHFEKRKRLYVLSSSRVIIAGNKNKRPFDVVFTQRVEIKASLKHSWPWLLKKSFTNSFSSSLSWKWFPRSRFFRWANK